MRANPYAIRDQNVGGWIEAYPCLDIDNGVGVVGSYIDIAAEHAIGADQNTRAVLGHCQVDISESAALTNVEKTTFGPNVDFAALREAAMLTNPDGMAVAPYVKDDAIQVCAGFDLDGVERTFNVKRCGAQRGAGTNDRITAEALDNRLQHLAVNADEVLPFDSLARQENVPGGMYPQRKLITLGLKCPHRPEIHCGALVDQGHPQRVFWRTAHDKRAVSPSLASFIRKAKRIAREIYLFWGHRFPPRICGQEYVMAKLNTPTTLTTT